MYKISWAFKRDQFQPSRTNGSKVIEILNEGSFLVYFFLQYFFLKQSMDVHGLNNVPLVLTFQISYKHGRLEVLWNGRQKFKCPFVGMATLMLPLKSNGTVHSHPISLNPG